MDERHRRSVAKAVSWRILATFTTTTIVFALTCKFTLAFSVGSIEALSKMVLYYPHERAWNGVRGVSLLLICAPEAPELRVLDPRG
jgi:uncharacterized membrane protein